MTYPEPNMLCTGALPAESILADEPQHAPPPVEPGLRACSAAPFRLGRPEQQSCDMRKQVPATAGQEGGKTQQFDRLGRFGGPVTPPMEHVGVQPFHPRIR